MDLKKKNKDLLYDNIHFTEAGYKICAVMLALFLISGQTHITRYLSATLESSSTSFQEIKICVEGDTVYIQGIVQNSTYLTTGSAVNLFEIPENVRPKNNIYKAISVYESNSSVRSLCPCSVNPSTGKVTAMIQATQGGWSNCYFYVDLSYKLGY